MRLVTRHVIVIVVSSLLIAALTALTRIINSIEIPKAPMSEVEERSTVIRTDFSDDAAWEALCAAIEAPVGDFRAYVRFVSDQANENATPAQIAERLKDGDQTFVFIVDRTAITHPDHPILVVDLHDEPGRSFRVIPSAMWAVQNNLSIANMDFREFAEAVDSAGIFRGFSPR
jgi:hypothetical protein